MANLYLVGLPGAGKTTVGRIISRRLNLQFIDLDRLVLQREQLSMKELYARGESYFQDRETEALIWVRDHCDRCVVATGGGIADREENVRLLEQQPVLYVVRRPDSILRTLNTDKRPSFENDPDRIYQFAEARTPVYERIADVRVMNNRSLHSCIGQVLRELEQYGFPDEQTQK